MHAYIKPLAKIFKANENAGEALRSKAYLKDQFEFYGLKTNLRRDLIKEFINQHGLPDDEQLDAIATDLINQPQREFHYFAIELLLLYKKQWPEDIIHLFEKLITTNSWWDTVDFIAVHCVGFYSQQFPKATKKKINTWSNSKNMWLNRTSIIYQNNLKSKTDEQVLFENIRKHAHVEEFFIRKAIGWALRQYGRTNPKSVTDFCKTTKLKPLSHREALRNIADQSQ